MKQTTTKERSGVSAIVSILMALTGTTQDRLARVIGRDPGTVSRRLSGGSWRHDELRAIAAHFEMPMSVWDTDPADIWKALGVDADSVTVPKSAHPTLFDQDTEWCAGGSSTARPVEDVVIDLRDRPGDDSSVHTLKVA